MKKFARWQISLTVYIILAIIFTLAGLPDLTTKALVFFSGLAIYLHYRWWEKRSGDQ